MKESISRHVAAMTVVSASIVFTAMSGIANAEQGIILGGGDFVLLPFAEAQARQDSNVRRLEVGEKDDMAYSLKAGTGLKNSTADLTVKGNLWGLAERFADLTEEDHEDFGESLALTYGKRETLELSASEDYTDSDSYDTSIGKIANRKDFNAKAGIASAITDKNEAEMYVRYSMSDYENKDTFDWDQAELGVELSQKLTDKSAATLTPRAGSINSDGNKLEGNYYGARLGLKSVRSEKITGSAGAGFLVQETDGDDLNLPDFDMGIIWKTSPQLVLLANATRGVEPGATAAELNAYKVRTSGDLSAKWSWFRTFSLTLSERYLSYDYEFAFAADAAKERTEETWTTAIKLAYDRQASPVTGYLEWLTEEKTSDKKGFSEYDRDALTLNVRYDY